MNFERKRQTRAMVLRYLEIDRMLKAESYPNTTMLARQLEVSIPTISRDIDALRKNYGAPIEYDRKRNGYYYNGEFTEFDFLFSFKARRSNGNGFGF